MLAFFKQSHGQIGTQRKIKSSPFLFSRKEKSCINAAYVRKLFSVLILSKHTKKRKKPWLLWVAFGMYGEGFDWKTRQHGSYDLPASSAGWCICTQLPEAVSLPCSHGLLSELVSGSTIAFWRQFYPWLLSVRVQSQSFISFLSWHMLVHPWFWFLLWIHFPKLIYPCLLCL